MARRLILNVDDIGIHEGAVHAAIETIIGGPAASGSLMAPCPGAPAALAVLGQRPDVPVGVHLTLTSDFADRPWPALTGGSTIQDHGRLLPIGRREELLARVDVREVEAEFRAQIETVLAAGLQPSHLDWHSLADGGRPDIFDLTLTLADEYATGIRAWTDHGRAAVRARGYPTQEHPFVDSFGIPPAEKTASLLERLRDLPEGLSEWAIHPATAVEYDDGADVRRTDHEFLMDPAVRRAFDEEDVEVLGYGDPRLRSLAQTGAVSPSQPQRGTTRSSGTSSAESG